MIDNTITLEGLFTIVLFAVVDRDVKNGKMQYKFMTNSDGTNTAKSPAGMFEEIYIPNDAGYVIDKMNEYYG